MTLREVTIGYYSDFLVYPLVMIGLAAVPIATREPASALAWLGAAVVGLCLWTLVEYLAHRFILHKVPYFRGLHDAHHAAPGDLISTPIWMSFLVLVASFLAAWWLLGLDLGSGAIFGLTAGYLYYSFLHHILHHWRIVPGSPFYGLKHKHALHHHRHDEGNFGVTSLFWDHVFGTALAAPGRTRAKG
ncbi:sterol desaturase family protein [Kaistia dalseonensis]|uniref:Sterol desaturase/sphingolipid hydroxylase (Fatty acid hydroxylase superfamily) n=1 Tax=Kaistia dalseonensis TaxID=410840 RepID=A0ABU0HBK8_9HYPH|nr:sterol desaturase family protein [Kaistia dalseonensis]MCX5497063.1 sterol desaturase family protein [Kaistia dalseonensis]MDQ0439689.1 sterol desaturase/sphingolipid hydroxylase (fatty acid hydroxylase superfamily) [Kaistia dalseonensis]